MHDNDEISIKEIHGIVKQINDVMERYGLDYDEAVAIAYIQEDIIAPFNLLSEYDSKRIDLPGNVSLEDSQKIVFSDEIKLADPDASIYKLEVKSALKLVKFVIDKFHENHGFGIEREPGALAGIISSLYLTGYGEELYPTPMEKAANLLYLVIKNHPFVNGNKRIGVFLFCIFMEIHGPKLVGEKIGYPALPAIALLIANSAPEDKTLIVRFVMGLFK